MSGPRSAPVVIVGAGVSGLSCARALVEEGREARILERARGVGGRCATRRLERQPFDHGTSFLHGRDPGFLAALAAVPGTNLPGWPSQVSGAGLPCQPDAFAPGERRLAFAEGVVAFPRHLAEGLDVRLESEVAAVVPRAGGVELRTAGGGSLQADAVVLALAPEQALALLEPLEQTSPEAAAAAAVLRLSRSQACLSLLALYPDDAPRPAWHVLYPEDSEALQLVSHDSSKRPDPARLGLVLQGRPSWSRARLADPGWPRALLFEAGRLLGPWAARPSATYAHRWSHARSDMSAELSGPLLIDLPGGGRLGLCGDRLAPGAGVEAAWRSGRLLAGRILAQGREG
jgi:predicted NAD/FAD-dependent oxidoreductase